jgi:hypothetical protein
MFRRAVQILAVVVLAAIPRAASAAPVVIDFDALGDLDSVVGQYAGLTFSGATALTSGISLNEFEFPPNSGLNVVFDDGGPMRVDFASSMTSVGGYFTYVAGLTLSAFDLGDNLLGSVSSGFASNLALSGDAGSSPNEFLSLAFADISYITVTGDFGGASFTLDDLTFDGGRAVPEPGIVSLLFLGLGVAIRKKSSRRL